MSYAYIKRAYGVNPVPGQRVEMDGRPGVIVAPKGETQYVRVRFDGQDHASNCHPTWRMNYSPAQPAPAEQ